MNYVNVSLYTCVTVCVFQERWYCCYLAVLTELWLVLGPATYAVSELVAQSPVTLRAF